MATTMNAELKNFLDLAFDGYTVVEDIINKSYISIIGQMVSAATEVPSVISNFSDLQAEITALPGSANEADLVAYIETKFKGIGSTKAQAILTASLKILTDLISDGVALKSAISS